MFSVLFGLKPSVFGFCQHASNRTSPFDDFDRLFSVFWLVMWTFISVFLFLKRKIPLRVGFSGRKAVFETVFLRAILLLAKETMIDA